VAGSADPIGGHCGTGIWPDRDIAAGWCDIETPCASLPTRSPSQPRTPARKAGVLDLRKRMRERDGLSAGGRWIRTFGSCSRDRQPWGRDCCLENGSGSVGEPKVRIHLPPAESPSLARTFFRRSKTTAFRAGVRGRLGERVGRDAPGVRILYQPAAISLSSHIPVPQRRRCGGRECQADPNDAEPSGFNVR